MEDGLRDDFLGRIFPGKLPDLLATSSGKKYVSERSVGGRGSHLRTSSPLLVCSKVKTGDPWARAGERLMAHRTGETSRALEAQAEPVLA